MTPTISVVISCRNYGRYLTDAIHSLVGGATSLGMMPGQSFLNFEIIVVDDASDDNTSAVARHFLNALGDERFTYLRLDAGSFADGQPYHGTPVANNTGIGAARGEYIAIFHADDLMETWRLEKLLDLARQNPHCFVYDDITVVTGGQRTKLWPMADYHFNSLLYRSNIHGAILFPRQAWLDVGGYAPIMRYGREDWAFNVALGDKGWCGVRLPAAGYLYRREGQGRTTRNTNRDWHEFFTGQMRSLFPHLYRGEFSEMCCGNDVSLGNGNQGDGGTAAQMRGAEQTPGADGMILIEYNGLNAGDESWYGPVTGRRYVFGGNRKIGYVDNRDAPGMLRIYEAQRTAFVIPAEAPAPPVALAATILAAVDAPVVEAATATPVIEADSLSVSAAAVDAPDPTPMNVEIIRNYVAEVTDEAILRAMYAAEKNGKARKTALEAISNRIAELNPKVEG